MKKTLLLLTMLVSLAAFRTSSTRTITGTVYDSSDKKPIPGVAVKVIGEMTGVSTDVDGHYSIAVPDGRLSLVFTYIGFQSQSIKIEKKKTIDVWLKADGKALTEVVVVGYGAAKSKQQIQGRTYSSGDMQTAVQNLPADIVDKIQIVDDYGDQSSRVKTPAALKEVAIRGAGNVVMKDDKLEYKASAYPVQSNAQVEDILKKLPGVNVDANGNITSQGKQVTKVRINGKDFFGRMAPVNNESYSPIVENTFIDPISTPLSTFAVDVDAASYSNFRRFINAGQLPPKNAIRIEEMVNYFHYDIAPPTNGDPVAIHTELSTAPWNPQHRLLRIALKAKEVKMDKLPASNLVFLLDVSGSMGEPNKLTLVKASMKLLVDQLRDKDHVAIVTYAGEAGIKLQSTPGSDKNKIKEAIDELNANGSTNGGGGIVAAYQVAKDNFIKGGNNRIILATDGDFNVGPSSDKDMQQLIEEQNGSGVSISILGFGMGNLKDSKMETMADKGHGNYAYIDNITEATKAMVTEFGGTLFTVARDVKMQVEFNPARVQAYRLLGYEDRLLAKEDFNNDRKMGGDMGVGHHVTALYEIIPAGLKDSFTTSVDPLKYQKPNPAVVYNNSPEMVTVKFRYKQPDGDVSKMELATVNDEPKALSKTSDDFRFAASVAELGLLLRDSEYKQQSNFSGLIRLAKDSKGKDDDGYRAEFIRLAESAKLMSKPDEVVMAEGKDK